MGIEDVGLSVHRIVEFSLRIIHSFLQNHPYVSTVLLCFFLLYGLFSYIVSFLLHCFPFFAFVAILLQIFWTSERFNARDQERDSKSFVKDVCIDTNQRAQTSRRRSNQVKHEGWEGKDVVSPAGISVQNASSTEETQKEISADSEKEIRSSAIASAPQSFIQDRVNNLPFMRSEPSMSDFLAFGGLNSQTHKSNGDYESVSESSEEVKEEEEEAREDGDKAVKRTEDDQKNLMDLGFSEMERNRRLESLIAKRRGRKPIRGQVEEDLISIDRIPSVEIAKVSIAKHRPFDVPSNFKEVEGLPIPGSAPSVLLPMRNPFDLPYGPLEEKPNLMVDSFQREFTAATQKELSFCRHGSFCFGPSFPLQSHQNLQEAMSNPFFSTEKWDGLGNSRFRRSSPSEREDHEWLVEPLLFKGRQITNAEIKKKFPGNDVELHLQDSSSDTTSSSSSENLEEMFNGDRAGAPHNLVTDHDSLTCSTQSGRVTKDPLYDLSNLPSNGGKIGDCFSFALKAAYHTPTYSIASDLQVEVSEISSPPMTLDGTNSPTDGESNTYDGDIEKEINLGGDEIWESSSDVYRRIEKEIELRKAHEENVSDHVNFWAASERSEDVASEWNPFAAVPDSVDEPEKSDISDREMKDKDSVGGEDQSSDSVSEEPGEYQDNAGSDKSAESDKILDLIGEREKPSTYDDNTEIPKPGEDEESTEESEDSGLHRISGEAIIPGGLITSNVEEVASNSSSSSPPKFNLQEEISIRPNSSSAFNSVMETETENNEQSSSSDEEAASSAPAENHLVEASATCPTTASDFETLSSWNSQEEFMDRVSDPSQSSEGVKTAEDFKFNEDKNEDIEEFPKLDDEETDLKSSDKFEFESEKLMGYEPDLDPATLAASLPADTSGEETKPGQFTVWESHQVELVPERHPPAILSGAEEDNGYEGKEKAGDHLGAPSPTMVENNSELKKGGSLESEKWIKHGGPRDEPDPDDINDPISLFLL